MKTLYVLPNAIGDVIRGTGVADRLARDGSLDWIVNPSAADALVDRPFGILHPPSALVRRRAHHGAPTEILRDTAAAFLQSVRDRGPYDRVVNPHMSRASSLMAGAVPASKRLGPAVDASVHSDPWSDYYLSSVVMGMRPEWPMEEVYSLVAGLDETVWTDFSARRRTGGGFIVLQAGSGWPSKRLSVEQAARTADALSVLGPVVLPGGPHEEEYLAAIRSLMTTKSSAFAPGPLARSLDAVFSASLVVTTDTCLLHAANAAGVPCVALLGPTRVFPRRNGYAIAPARESGWQAEGDDSLSLIDSAFVAAVAGALLAADDISPSAVPDGLTVWDCRGDEPFPLDPMPADGDATARALLAEARGRAFALLLEEKRPDLPRLKPRRNPWAARYRSLGNIRRKVDELLAGLEPLCPIFDTTFPGQDPDAMRARWIRHAQAESERLLARP